MWRGGFDAGLEGIPQIEWKIKLMEFQEQLFRSPVGIEAQEQRRSVGVEKKVACVDGLVLKSGKRETIWT